MPRSMPERPVPTIPAAPPLLEADLAGWAGERLAAAGRREALLGRVEWLRLLPGGVVLEARVRGNRSLPYRVRIRARDQGLDSECTCVRGTAPACKHAVAALEALRFPLSALPGEAGANRRSSGSRGRGSGRIVRKADGVPGLVLLGGTERTLTRNERIALARDEESGQRRAKSRSHRWVVTDAVDDDGSPFLLVTAGGKCEPLAVREAGSEVRLHSCSCSDFADNELATCLHIEKVRRRRKRAKSADDPAISVLWTPREWIERVPDPIREVRAALPEPPSRRLTRYFEPAGWLRSPPQGDDASAWTEEAIAAARRVARRRGCRFDLDPLVRRRIAEQRERESMIRRLGAIDSGAPAWNEIIGRLGFRLYPYQETGALFLARRGRAFLADDMGLGKTVQSIVAALLLRKVVGARRALVVCPASLKYQWRHEIAKVCGERATVVEGHPAARREAYGAWHEGFLIVNYELVLRDLEEIRAAGAELVILDEAQRIKNWGTKTARAVKQLDSPHAFILTGTPLENRLLELHSLVEFLHPRALGPRWRLVPLHAVTEARGRVVAYEGLEVLRQRLRGFFLRRERSEVLDQLPDRTDNTFWTGMTAGQRRPYRLHASRIAALVASGGALGAGEVRALLQHLTRMRTLCNARAQYYWDDIRDRLRDPRPPTAAEKRAVGSPKFEELAHVLEELLDETDTKIVVFSEWERALRIAEFLVRETLLSRDLHAGIFHGRLSSRSRGELLEVFRFDPEMRVLFSTDAGGLGLNLQEAASIVIHLDVPWNPAVLEQRVGRVHRIGQRRSVQVLHLVTRESIEERVRQVLADKRALFEGLLVDRVDRVQLGDKGRGSLVRQIEHLIDPTSAGAES